MATAKRLLWTGVSHSHSEAVMTVSSIRNVLTFAAQIGADARESDDVRLHKSMLVMSTMMFFAAGLLWGLMYFALGETATG
jgi:hypothetical protein